MSRPKELLVKVLSGNADASIRFTELCGLLERLGFTRHVRGSHHVFSRTGVSKIINLQVEAGAAKPYQVRQVRLILLRHGLTTIAGDAHGE